MCSARIIFLVQDGKNTKKSQSVCGVKLPSGLKESDRLPYPIFTPATKEEFGKHDINITEEEAKKIAGEKEIEFIKHKAIEIYNHVLIMHSQKALLSLIQKWNSGGLMIK